MPHAEGLDPGLQDQKARSHAAWLRHRWKMMKNNYRDDTFNARLQNAAKAKKAIQDRIKGQLKPGDPEFERLRAERQAIAEAREKRQAERKAEREAEAARRAAEKAEREEAERKAAEEAEAAAIALEAERKAARDARYAARKARRR
jgi:hypothetical protein